MRSMTGFGTAERTGPAGTVACEIRSVNHRQLKISLRVPPSLSGCEAELEAKIREATARGAVSGAFRVGRPETATAPLVDEVLARRYAETLADLGAELGLPGQPDLAMISSLPGVLLTAPAAGEGSENLFRTAAEALDAALAEMEASRTREGTALHRDFKLRLKKVEGALRKVRARAPRQAAAARDRLSKRLREALEGHPDRALKEAVAREIALMAERSDVTEEATRLQHHLEAFRSAASGKGEVGRRLDFLLQEMLREVNTIGSKSQDAAIAEAVVDMKVEVDRMKEQAANIE
jgi:uncharacterized protein (TIGR00255 family)